MDDLERRALANLRFDWAPTPEAVWLPDTSHVKGLNDNALQAVMAAFNEAEASQGPSPIGVVITGQQGTGKTHILGMVRAEVQRRGGYFFLLSLLHGKNFWQNVVHAIRTGLHYPGSRGERQLTVILGRLADRLGLSGEVRRQVLGESTLTRRALDQTTLALRDADRLLGHECRHTARAMVLLAAQDPTAQEVGESYLMSTSEFTPGERIEWGIHPDPKPAHEIVGQVSRLLALTGPSVLAIDQIDTLIAQSGRSTDAHASSPVGLPREQLLEQIGTGLMDLRDATHRMVTVVSCQYQAWEGIRSLPSVGRRFREAPRLHNVPSAAVGRALVEARFGPRFAEVAEFRPPFSTWPVWPEAFAEADRFTPGQLFKRIDDHIRSCLDAGTVVPLTSLNGGSDQQPRRQSPAEPVSEKQLSALDDRFDDLLGQVDPSAALNKATEDVRMPALLEAGLRAYIEEQGDQREQYSLDPPSGDNPALHARLRRTLDKETEDELHWSFRAIVGPHHRAVQNRIERLQVTAGLDRDVPKRKAYLLRTGNWATGTPKTKERLDEFHAAGGVMLKRVEINDLRTFAALERILEPMGGKLTPEVSAWLRHRRCAGQTALFRAVFGEPGTVSETGIDTDPRPRPPAGNSAGARSHNPAVPASPEQPSLFVGMEGPQWPNDDPDTAASQAAVDPPHLISLGRRADTGAAVPVPLESLRKHIVIFAGSGSGKTVLIRRLIEECALRGVSSIVLDPNNDLARLGDAWPQPPDSWDRGDAAKAADYLAHTDVVIWTPRREMGRPLSFQPLPDLAAVGDDPDEFGLALDTAVAALAPRARADGSTAKAERARAVLRTALAFFAREGGSGLTDFLEVLADLPDGVTTLTNAHAMAEDMSQTLKAAVINDPLFGGSGALADPGTLLTPVAGKRARVSVVSLIGLPTDQQRQSFVNQLQMALFAWIKQHPAGNRPLGGLFVMDEAQTLAPSGGMTACTASTLALASQARKYGLGLVFATQSPKGIHNRIVGNAATQYFGFLNSPVQVTAAKEMAAAKSSVVLDISRLSAGQFYAVGEGMPFQKVKTPMCLSHHPPSALTFEEVLARAREGA
jgi:hypothetical protein